VTRAIIACEDDHVCRACRESMREVERWDGYRTWWALALRLTLIVTLGVYLVVLSLLAVFSPLFAWVW